MAASNAAGSGFANTRRLTIAPLNDPVGLEVLGGPGAAVETLADAQTGSCAYLWGMPGHCDVPRSELLRWMTAVAMADDVTPLRDVSGLYVLLIDDRRRRRVYMVSDIMGVRPWFIGQYKGRLVCGSEVWPIHDAGLNEGGLNYDAIASWLRYAYDCTGQSLLADYAQIPPASVTVWEHGSTTQKPYATYAANDAMPSRDELIQTIHAGLSRTFDAQTRHLDRVQIALSGGFDSRYLAALASRAKHLKIEAFSVQDRPAEGIVAKRVAAELKLDLQVLATDGSIWNMYDEPYHFTAGGFPITKQLSYFAASQRPGVPCLNGFLGEALIRGTLDRAHGKRPGETIGDPAIPFASAQRLKHTQARFDLLDQAFLSRCDERALSVWRRQFARHGQPHHLFAATALFVRQRHYLSNNFLQHLDVAEAIVPFHSFITLQNKFAYDDSCFAFETYEALLARLFPEIGAIPHNSRMGATNDLNPARSRATRQWCAAVLRGLSDRDRLPMVSRRKAIPRLLGALAGRRDVEVVPLFLYRLHLLDTRLRRRGLPIRWDMV